MATCSGVCEGGYAQVSFGREHLKEQAYRGSERRVLARATKDRKYAHRSSYLPPAIFGMRVCIVLQELLYHFVVAFPASDVNCGSPVIIVLIQIRSLPRQDRHRLGIS